MTLRGKLLTVSMLYFAEGFPFGIIRAALPVYFRIHCFPPALTCRCSSRVITKRKAYFHRQDLSSYGPALSGS
jgi:hypothetical protein